MLVYGDQRERVRLRDRAAEIEERRRGLDELPIGIERHAGVAALFIALAGVTQGIADTLFERDGHDDTWPEVDDLLSQLIAIAAVLLASWNGEAAQSVAPISLPPNLPDEVGISLPEGYAFYALYPESYAAAARRLNLAGTPVIIGLRSIGTGLAAVIAAALGADRVTTLRPTGEPFARRVAVSNTLETRLLGIAGAHYIIVDEGPGLSGSSLGCVADWLEDHGIPRDRIAFLPGHDGDLGREASEAHRQRWAMAQRPVVPTDELLAGRLASWVEGLTGPLDGPLEDIGGGAWRSHRYADESEWPAVQPSFERRKLLARRGAKTYLVKFAGLGIIVEEKRALAEQLRGFVPETLGLVHGWLVERWLAEAAPTIPTPDELTAYLVRRSSIISRPGASAELLDRMIRRNLPNVAMSFDLPRLQSMIRPVKIDGRLHAHEWLRLPSGGLFKADALDHHAAHDLIGCQDIAWDIAGAEVELGVRPGIDADPDLLAFMRTAYLAFQTGLHRMAAAGLDNWPAEQARNIAAAERYEALASR